MLPHTGLIVLDDERQLALEEYPTFICFEVTILTTYTRTGNNSNDLTTTHALRTH